VVSEERKSTKSVVGRFAPSPTGPIHFGTLLAAVGSYLLAKQADGQWLLRIEDLDPPRVVAGAADAILSLLEVLGLEWDGPVVYQSDRLPRYAEVLSELRARHLVFECNCSRRDILASAPHPGEEGPIYPGTCRLGISGTRKETAIRLRVPDREISFVDGVFGYQSQNLEKQLGDFVLHRSDGLFAYQLAVVVDDIDTGVTQVVRGADLLSSTPRQIYLYDCLGADLPCYYHLPLVLAPDGQKLSKRNRPDIVVTEKNGPLMIWQALAFLGQKPPRELYGMAAIELLAWALDNFSKEQISNMNKVPDFFDHVAES
jgi:glutamyl-Q tRNA(Asp) synthetase